jgi:hypothetical protein
LSRAFLAEQNVWRKLSYVMDHIQPLKRRGADSPSNMQWQTVATAKAKDLVKD